MALENELDLYNSRLNHANSLEEVGINPYPAEPPKRSHTNIELIKNFPELEGSLVSVVGRMISKRVHGNLTFLDLEDETAKIQTMIGKGALGDRYKIIKDHYETGDFVGTSGILTKTKTGEVTVKADEVAMLTKALRPIPRELKDPELQQRQRYLHTLVDTEARERFRIRSRLVAHMRDYFINNIGCLEVETPIMDTTYGGAAAKPFKTYHNALGTDLFLRISNELYLKRFTVGGYYEGVFEFSRDFRNEGMDRTHNPEFTQVELYKPFWDYNNMMNMAEDVMVSAIEKIKGTTKLTYQGKEIDYKAPWRRLTIYDGIKDKYQFDPEKIEEEELRRKAILLKVIDGNHIGQYSKGEILLEMFEKAWEKELIQPTFVLDYPDDTSALTKRHRKKPELTERFEMYAGGMETMNCYTELNDPRDQRKRFEIELEKRRMGNQETMPFDEDFILAQEYGMPLQAGIGISIDRWTMLITNLDHIRQVIYFPTLKPKV